MTAGYMAPKVRDAVRAIAPRAIEWRRYFHANPELSWREERTQQAILDHLRSLELADLRPIARTGATALVAGGKPGPCVMWRADIDALPIPERSGLPFASKNEGVMHACGHDAHTAVALALAELLAAKREKLHGSVRLLFQPAEEHAGAAQLCVKEGVLEEPRVSSVLGLHVSADVPLGAINVAPGPFFAAPTAFRLVIQGRGGHAAAPQQAVDAVLVAAHVITALQSIVSRSVPPSETAVLTVGKVQAGFRGNVIAESATMTGTIRTYNPLVQEVMISRMEEVAAGVCAAFGAGYTLQHSTSCPALVNDDRVTALVVEEAAKFFGVGNIHATPSMGADDMSVFLEERPGCYLWLGARNEAKGIAGRHHDPGFMIDEDAIPLGIEFGLQVIEANLRQS
ncbi:MAG: amidohydrolase [Dehalococcoidia bacterium]|nr:amidohydrolase [Dehalococcoidia bacterium]